jgi:hypothetical protein
MPLVTAVPLGIWINEVSSAKGTGFINKIESLGGVNWLAGVSIALPVVVEVVRARSRRRAREQKAARDRTARDRELQLLTETLRAGCVEISRLLGVETNGRFMSAHSSPTGPTMLRHVRGLAIETVNLPAEFGFTGVSVNEPNVVVGEAFHARRAIYRDLAEDHLETYSATVRTQIDEAQRWVLACPVLRLDSSTGMHVEENPPYGVLVFYGVAPPSTHRREKRLADASVRAMRASEIFSLTFDLISPVVADAA